MRYFIRLSYDGKNYHGWQIQENSITIQELIENGLRLKTGFEGSITGCGRTDTGVHASTFYCHFDHPDPFDETWLKGLARQMNRYLPKDIAIQNIFRVKDDAHSRFDAKSRTYKYFINQKKDPFSTNFAWYLFKKPDIAAMNEACKVMKTYIDFTSFSKLHSNVKTNNCTIYHAEWKVIEDQLIFTIRADRFLRDMVRATVGTLIGVGAGKTTIEEFRQIIESKNRQNAGTSVPAQGLFLYDVEYDWQSLLPEADSNRD